MCLQGVGEQLTAARLRVQLLEAASGWGRPEATVNIPGQLVCTCHPSLFDKTVGMDLMGLVNLTQSGSGVVSKQFFCFFPSLISPLWLHSQQ